MPISDEAVKAADRAYLTFNCRHECTVGATCICMRAALEAAEAVRGRTHVTVPRTMLFALVHGFDVNAWSTARVDRERLLASSGGNSE